MGLAIALASIGMGVLSSANTSRGLSVDGHQLKMTLDSARQLAVTQNRYVQVRFYLDENSSRNHVDQIGVYLAESPFYSRSAADYAAWIAAGKLKQAERDFSLNEGAIIPGDAVVSNLLSLLRSDSEVDRMGSAGVGSAARDFVAFYYHPDGSTDFKTINGNDVLVNDAYLSLVAKNRYEAGPPALPQNYFMLAFDPITGRTATVRP